MAAGEEPAPRVEDDPSMASDALSLHTIAEADVYASQEQEDADFALALALEEQETQRYARTQAIMQGRDPNQVDTSTSAPAPAPAPAPAQTEALPPYRDDPDAVEIDAAQDGDLPPYRDDPDAVPIEGEADEAASEPAKRQRAFVRILRKIFKTWLCCLMISTITTIIIIIVVIALVFVYGTKVDSKEAAFLASGSSDYKLKLPRLYPALEAGTKDTCKNTWEKQAVDIPCHRMILSSAWDNGLADETNAEGADPFFYSEAVCTSSCRASLLKIARPLTQSCTNRTDRFDFASYGNNGKAYLEKGKIEEGPVHVVKNLLERYERFCKQPRRRYETEWGTCSADLWMRWGIVDGKNEAHLNGLNEFMEQTSVKKTIPASTRTITSLSSTGMNRTRTIRSPRRNIGPGAGETDCNACTLDWLERKMRSFEFGQILDPATGQALGLSEFRKKLGSAIWRCSSSTSRRILSNVDRKWAEFGWWCGDKPCSIDKPQFSRDTMAILHGWPMPKDGPPGFKELLEKKEAPELVLQAAKTLINGMMDMPCGIGFTELVAKNEILPYEHIVGRLCSDPCRNALDRLSQNHRTLFAEAARDPKYGHMFQYPTKAAELVNKVCLSSSPGAILQSSEHLCAPGYAAVGHPEWIFAGRDYDPPTRPAILDAFSREIDALAARLSKHGNGRFGSDPDSARTRMKKLAESACNTCAGGIFIGSEPNWKKTVDEYLDDKDVNGTEYVAAAKKGWLTCGKMYGMTFTERQKKQMWKKYGLDRFD